MRGCGSCGGDMETCTCGQPPVILRADPYRSRPGHWAVVAGLLAAALLLAAGCQPTGDTQPTPSPQTAPSETGPAS